MSDASFRRYMNNKKRRDAVQAKHPCRCITTKGEKCRGIGSVNADVMQRTTVMYKKDALPLTHEGSGFLCNTVTVCPTHWGVLLKGHAVRTWASMATPPAQEKLPLPEPKLPHYEGCMCVGCNAPTTKSIRCGKCKAAHATVNDVRACHGVRATKAGGGDMFLRGRNVKPVRQYTKRTGDWYTQNTQVKKINNPYR